MWDDFDPDVRGDAWTLMEYEEFVGLTILAAGVGCDRKAIKAKVSRSRRLICWIFRV